MEASDDIPEVPELDVKVDEDEKVRRPQANVTPLELNEDKSKICCAPDLANKRRGGFLGKPNDKVEAEVEVETERRAELSESRRARLILN